MKDTFGYKQLTVNQEQLDNLQFVEMSPITREILENSKVKVVSNLASPDLETAANAGRALAGKYFLVD